MKRSAYIGLILTGLLASAALAQTDSLAEAARRHKEQQAGKPVPAKVYTNDNLPTNETISTVGAPVSETPATNPGADGQPADANSTPAKDGAAAAKPADESKLRQKRWEDWRDKIQKQKSQVEQMQKDQDEIERQFRVTSGSFYNSAQQRIFNGEEMAKEDKAYREQMEQKKKAIEDAKQKIDDMQEEARRAGVPSSYRD